jgi:hypothetical protein
VINPRAADELRSTARAAPIRLDREGIVAAPQGIRIDVVRMHELP